MTRSLKVLIADDHPVVRAGLKQILLREAEVSQIEEATNALEVLDLVDRQDWDLVILDLSMPGGGGLETLKSVKLRRPALPVLILSMHPEHQFAHRVLKGGASGYLSKDSAPDQLVVAMNKVLSGGTYVSASMAERLAEDLDRDVDKPAHERLSGREFSVMTMLASGKSVGDIARELSLSVNAVSTYRARVLEKLSIKNTAELIRYVLEKGLVP
jgi:two-component system invasion response regulator UvrY